MEFTDEGSHVYWRTPRGDKLRLWPIPAKPTQDPSPALVLFFGGGWATGSPSQFAELGKHLASHGITAVLVDYRVNLRHQSTVVDSLHDARQAIRWVRDHAPHLGIDPSRIAAGGGSAGGYLAAASAMPWIASAVGPAEEAVPDALVLFNPVLDLAGATSRADSPGVSAALHEINAAEMSPSSALRTGLPPTIIFHGRDDDLVPFRSVEQFTRSSVQLGNRCELVGFDGQGHGFFNHPSFSQRVSPDGAEYIAVRDHLDAFLDSIWPTPTRGGLSDGVLNPLAAEHL